MFCFIERIPILFRIFIAPHFFPCQDGYDFLPPGGESQQMCEDRVASFLEINVIKPYLQGPDSSLLLFSLHFSHIFQLDLRTAPELERTVALFSHGLTIRTYFRRVFKADKDNVWLHQINNTGACREHFVSFSLTFIQV